MRPSSSPLWNSRNTTFRDTIQQATAKTEARKSLREWIEMKNGIFLVGAAFVLSARGGGGGGGGGGGDGSGGVDVGGGDRGPLP
jgi:hypothetical protein